MISFANMSVEAVDHGGVNRGHRTGTPPIVCTVTPESSSPNPSPTGSATISPTPEPSPVPPLPTYTPIRYAKPVVMWQYWLSITVTDQFDEELNNIYSGSKVFERLPESPEIFYLNETLSGGKYSDPVGAMAFDPNPYFYINIYDQNAVNDWCNREPIVIPYNYQPTTVLQYIRVWVDQWLIQPDPAVDGRIINALLGTMQVSVYWSVKNEN